MLTAFSAFIRKLLGLPELEEYLTVIHQDVQDQIDRTNTLAAQIPDIVKAAISNAEAAKDLDHQDDVAGLKAANDSLQAQLDAVRQAASAN